MNISPQARSVLWVIFTLLAICSVAQTQMADQHPPAAPSQKGHNQRRQDLHGQKQRSGPRFSDKTDLVTLDVLVTDKNGAFEPGLKPQDFEVFEDGVRQ